MTMSTAAELALITAAKGGDETAKLALLAEYKGNIEHTVYANPGYEADDLRSELTLGLLETINAFDPSQGERLWPSYAAGKMRDALKIASDALYPVDVPIRTAQRVRAVNRRVDDGQELADALAAEHLTQHAYLGVNAAFGYADLTLHDEAEHEWDEARSNELAEVALDGMSDKQAELCRIKYGFTVPIPTDSNSNGLPDVEVADHYNTPERIACARSVARRTVTDNITAGLIAGEVAVRKYLASDGIAA